MKTFIAALAFTAFAVQAEAKGRADEVILPLKGEAPIPEGSAGVQLVFERVLDFAYMETNTFASAQVFQYLPIAVSNGLGISLEDVVVTELRAFPMPYPSDYVATAATVYVPSDSREELMEQLKTPNSPIFKKNSGAAAALVRLINPYLSSELPIREKPVDEEDCAGDPSWL